MYCWWTIRVKVLRQACFDYADCNRDCVYDSGSHKTWHQAVEDGAVAGSCTSGGRNEYTDFANYLVHIQLTAAERAILKLRCCYVGETRE